MNDNRYIFPALSAVALAILFPLYWIGQTLLMSNSDGEALYNDVISLNPSDILFVIISALMIYVYISLKRFLNDRHVFSSANIPLMLMIISVAIYSIGSLGMDAFMHFYGDQLHLPWHKGTIAGQTVGLIVSTIVFGALDIVLGVILFTRAREFSAVLSAFAVITIIQGCLEITVVFSPATFVIYPIALILLAILFLRQPETLDVV